MERGAGRMKDLRLITKGAAVWVALANGHSSTISVQFGSYSTSLTVLVAGTLGWGIVLHEQGEESGWVDSIGRDNGAAIQRLFPSRITNHVW
jgi:hypothetical protein